MTNNKKMLIVDDSKLDRTLIKEIFSDFDCDEANNGREALDVLRTKPNYFNVIILDMVMPIMDGFETLAEIRRMGVLGTIPIIVTTVDFNSIRDLNAVDFGIDDVMYKPVSTNLARRRVLNVIDAFNYRKENK